MKTLLWALMIISLSVLNVYAQQKSWEDYNIQGDKLYREKKYKEAAEMYEKAVEIGKPDNFELYYNAACCWSLVGEANKAFSNLVKAADLDLFYFSSQLKADEDLESLHKDKQWSDLISKLDERAKKLNESFPNNQPNLEVIKLPEPKYDGSVSVEKAINERRSVRTYKKESLDLNQISQILWAAYGTTKPIENGPAFLRGGLKTAPSAGALYPLEIYLVSGDVKDLKQGIYRYKPEDHSLIKIADGDFRKELCKAGNNQMMIENAPASIVYSAIYSRTSKKYGQRGADRYVCMDLGHSAENVYLQGQALGIGTCAIGAFVDLMVKKVVGMTKEEEALYIMPLGKLKD